MNRKSFYAVQEKLSMAGWTVQEFTYACLSEYEKDFFEIEFTGRGSTDYYQHRLLELGFHDCISVLDVGCGMGQWAIAMASLNRHITGTDINIGRLFVAKDIANAMSIQNVEFKFGEAERSSFADQAFDAVFCYGVFMFTHMPSTLADFYRIIKPGGKLYLNVNSIGWYLHLLYDRGWKKRNYYMMVVALRMMLKAWLGKQQNVMVSPKRLRDMVEHAGFQVMGLGPEGTVTSNGAESTVKSKYPAVIYGHPAVTEVLALKPIVS